MEIIKSFDFDGKQLQVYGTNDEPWFKAKDIAKILKYNDTDQAIRNHVDENDKKKGTVKTTGGLQQTFFINESGLYTLIFGSKKPIAKEFKHWVTSEVLPSIRKTGKYDIHERQYKTPKPMLTYRIETENDLHCKVVNFIRQQQEDKHLLFTTTLGEYLNPDTALPAWYKGYTKGMPDFVLFNPSSKYTGLMIEFKSPKTGGVVSNEQKQICQHFRELNYKCIISNNYDDIIIKLHEYINHIRIQCQYCIRKFKSKETEAKHLLYFHRITK